MEPQDYWDKEPSEENEINVDELRKTIRNEFLLDLHLAATTVRALPYDWQVEVLLKIMEEL